MSAILLEAVSFGVVADPMPQPRPKARRLGAKAIQIYTPQSKKIYAYKDQIKQAFLDAIGSTEPNLHSNIKLDLRFTMRRPANMLRTDRPDGITPHNRKPDVDNLIKTVMDALNGVAWHDDAQVVSLSAEKVYGSIILGGKSGRKRESGPALVEISIRYLDKE